MSGIYPVPSTRTSDLLSQIRLLSQLQGDQLDILRYQSQVSTGRRILTPSEDAPAAMRAMGLQRLLELKAQAKTNLSTTQSYLTAADTALSNVTKLLSEIRGLALSSMDTAASDLARQTAAGEVRRAIEQLVSVGNHQFRGRHLFAGGRTTTPPFELVGNEVIYRGNEGELPSYVDVGQPAASNIPGSEVFGAFSPGVRGTVDLNPVLTRETLLTDLHGGTGISAGSIAISDGTTTHILDIGSAATIGDVADLIAANAPTGRVLSARVAPRGLVLNLEDGLGGNLTVREVGSGTTAAELGILETLGAGSGPIIGEDLDPRLHLTTRLDDLLGSRAVAFIDSAGSNNNLIVEALNAGAASNGVTIQFVDDALLHASPGLAAGFETASYSATATAPRAALTLSGFGNNLVLTGATAGTSLNQVEIELVDAGAIGNNATVNYNAVTRVLSLGVDTAGATQVQTLVNAINAHGTFTAAHDPSEPADGAYNPLSSVLATDIGVVRGNTGNSGGPPRTFFVNIDPGATSASNIIAALQANAAFAAEYEVRLDDSDSTSATSAGKGAVDVDAVGMTDFGSGETLDSTSGIQIQSGEDQFLFRFDDAETVEDLLNTLNGSPVEVLAEIDPAGDRISIRSRRSGVSFRIGENGGTTAAQLGVRSLTEDTPLAELNNGRGVESAAGTDFMIRRKDGVQLDIDVSSAITIGDVLDLINNHPLNLAPATRVVAQLREFGGGIELLDANSAGAGTLEVEKTFESRAAIDLGLIPNGQTIASAIPATTASANVTFPAPNDANTALNVTAATPGASLSDVEIFFQDTLAGDVATAVFNPVSGRLTISIDSALTTANTVLAAINLEGTFTAALDTSSDPTNDGTGIVGFTGVAATTDGGRPEALSGTDQNPLEVAGVFNSLILLEQSLSVYNLQEIERAIELLDIDFDRVNVARAEIGARGRALDTLHHRMEDENIELHATLSSEIDTDLTEAISNLTARQAAYEATLRLTAQVFQMTLLSFL